MNCPRHGISPRCVVGEITRGTTIKRLGNKKIHYWGTTALSFTVLYIEVDYTCWNVGVVIEISLKRMELAACSASFSTARSVVEISCARAL